MSSACTPILVGMISMVLEILLLSKMAKFPFRSMDYSPWSSKNLIDRNRLKKLMQVGVDVTCMYTNFGGHGLSTFGDTATFKNGQISLLDHWHSHWQCACVDALAVCMHGCVHAHQFWSHAPHMHLVSIASPASEL